MSIEWWIYYCLSVDTTVENGKRRRIGVCWMFYSSRFDFLQIFGSFGAVTKGLFRSIKRFPSAL